MRYLQADKVFDGVDFLPEGTVIAVENNGSIQSLLSAAALGTQAVERLEGIICPGFVNAHCHLELSHLKGQISEHTGLPGFAMELMQKRQNFSTEEIAEAMYAADAAMWQEGIVAVGDICNGLESLPIKLKSKLYYHSFVELIALNPAISQFVFEKGKDLLENYRRNGLAGSLVPHAPYSVSAELVQALSHFDAALQAPICIHNQESEEEDKFLKGQASGFDALYAFLKLDISFFKAPNKSSMAHLAPYLTNRPRLFVHNTFTGTDDVQEANDEGTFWCLCPKANRYIENKLPPLIKFPEQQICIGTDSLASNDRLSIIEECRVLLENTAVSELTLLRAITSQGAKALGLQARFGKIATGKSPGLNLISLKERNLQFIKKLA